jgi:hypothetical protein
LERFSSHGYFATSNSNGVFLQLGFVAVTLQSFGGRFSEGRFVAFGLGRQVRTT